jgi:hypothetical protein
MTIYLPLKLTKRMKRSINKMIGYSIEAIDGPKGKVKDFLFDEESWITRYIEADFGGFFNKKKVLIPQKFLNKPDWDHKQFPIELTKDLIERCPDIDHERTVSREYENQLSKHYNYAAYWPHAHIATPDAGGMYFPTRPLRVPDKMVDEKDIETSLRSFSEVKGYGIKTLDGTLGHLDDLIVDDIDWQIVYAVVDTSNWMPWSKKVILSISWLKEISYFNGEVLINLHSDTIKDAPEFDPDGSVESNFEESLYKHYNKSFYEHKNY